jgi:DNA-binding transcriptional MerR regulator
MNDKRTEPGARTGAGPSAGLKQFLHFEGGIEDLALAADTVLSSLGALAGEDGATSINARLIRDYAQRGILSRPERLGKEALYRYQHLVELVAARILLNDGWPLAKVSDYFASARTEDLAALAAPQSPVKSALKAIKDIRDRSHKASARKPSAFAPSAPPLLRNITDRQVRLAELRAELPVHMSRIDSAHKLPRAAEYTSVSLAEDLHVLIGDARLRALTLEEAEAIGRAVTASLIQLRPKGGKP